MLVPAKIIFARQVLIVRFGEHVKHYTITRTEEKRMWGKEQVKIWCKEEGYRARTTRFILPALEMVEVM